MIKTKRIYDAAENNDGYRVLVDRIWPRGMTKDRAKIDLWLKAIAPSDSLRKWFSHDLSRCEEFKKRYIKELKGKEGLLVQISAQVKKSTVTLLYGTKEEKCNNATVLKEYLEKKYMNNS